MPGYQVLIAPRVKKDLKKIDQAQLKRIDAAILKLEKSPFLPGVKRLIAKDTAQYRIRIGDYRVLYDVDETNKIVIILRIGHRKDIYR